MDTCGSELKKVEVIRELDGLTSHDKETAHCRADDILVMYLQHIGEGDVANAFMEARDRVGFWYA